MMDEKILERMLNSLIEEAGPIAIENMEKEASKEAIPDVEFSKKHEEKMKEIFEMARRKDDGVAEVKDRVANGTKSVESKIVEADFANSNTTNAIEEKVYKYGLVKKIAIVIAATIVVSGVTITSVSAWRESFVKYFLDEKDEYSDVKDFKSENEFFIDNIYFGYLPNGFKFDKVDKVSTSNIIYFSCGDEYIILKNQKDKWNNQINTESGEVIDEIINEKEMVYYENSTMRSLSWQENNYTYLVHTNCDKNTLKKIVSNIEILD